VQELEWHLFAIIFLLGAAYTLKRDRHVRVDILYLKFSPKTRAWVDLLGSIFLLLPFCILVIFASHKFVFNSFLIQETSPDPGGLPARYLLKACIPIGFFLVLLQGFSQSAKSFLAVMQKDETSTD
jgi:TRAP-type mannitol/chloroaromatic compound transport system permease small subunit